MSWEQIQDIVQGVQSQLGLMGQELTAIEEMIDQMSPTLISTQNGISVTMMGLTVFVLACFVGYYVVWRVTPALHSPLMAVTNAISSVIIVGALIAAGPQGLSFSKIMGLLAVILASINIFGGFIVAQRMLSMFKKKR